MHSYRSETRLKSAWESWSSKRRKGPSFYYKSDRIPRQKDPLVERKQTAYGPHWDLSRLWLLKPPILDMSGLNCSQDREGFFWMVSMKSIRQMSLYLGIVCLFVCVSVYIVCLFVLDGFNKKHTLDVSLPGNGSTLHPLRTEIEIWAFSSIQDKECFGIFSNLNFVLLKKPNFGGSNILKCVLIRYIY